MRLSSPIARGEPQASGWDSDVTQDDQPAGSRLMRGFRLGRWTVRPNRGILEGPGGAVHLEPKQIDLLVYLAGRAPQVASKEEIFEAIWPGAYVAEVGLKRNVSQLRRALGDDAREPRIIKTIPKRGYQLLVSVTPLDEESARVAADSGSRPSSPDRADTGRGRSVQPPSTSARPSIAVLPFVDMSPDKDQEYFCDGIAEQIINSLAHVGGLRVAARTSAFSFKNKPGDIREIGKELGVATVLEGSVRKVEDRLRINPQLVNVEDGCHLWAQQYDRELQDIFGIQEEIAQSIAQALSVELSDKEKRTIEKASTRDVEAYDFYLRGRQFFYRSKRRSIKFALEMFTRATEKDPAYALAYAGKADCHSYFYMYFGGSRTDLEQAERASRTALELNPELAEVHAARGLAFSLSRRYVEAEQELKSAIALNPNLFEAHYFYARTCFIQGKFEKAVQLYGRASEVNPDDYQALSLLAFTYRAMNQEEKAEAVHRRTLKIVEGQLQLNPGDSRALYIGATSLLDLGEHDRGLEMVQRSLAIDPEDPYIVYGGACFYARLGRLEEALQCFEKAVEAGFVHKEWIDRDTDLDPIRDDERFRKATRKLEPKERP
jgi:TolB-like protein/Flp pilus assembly protein TadD